MGMLTRYLLEPGNEPPQVSCHGDTDQDAEEHGDHPYVEEIARLAEGRVTGDERDALISHSNRCPRCFDILSDTLMDLEEKQNVVPGTSGKRAAAWRPRQIYALAACFLIVLLGAGLLFKQLGGRNQLLTASVELDPALREILAEDGTLSWEGRKVDRLASMLRVRGVKVAEFHGVILLAAYQPDTTKSIFVSKEILRIRIEGGVAYLEVKEEPDDTSGSATGNETKSR